MADAGKTKVTLRSSDGQEFKVEEGVAFQSVTVMNMIEDTGSEFAVPLPNVDGKTLSKVLEYCNKHRCARNSRQCLSSCVASENMMCNTSGVLQ